jgi:signal transduction histidine kinase
MAPADSLIELKERWIAQVARKLARGEGVRASFKDQLERFFDQLVHAVETGDPAWVEEVLDQWVAARTQSDLETPKTNLTPLVRQIQATTISLAREALEPAEALELIVDCMPVFAFALETTAQREAAYYIENASRELDEARATMDRLDRSKSDFISIAAHELKTPLTLIEGYATMLRDQVGSHDGQFDILLEGIDNGAQRLRDIVDDMIDVSLIDNNLLALIFQPVWLNRILDVIRRELEPIAEARSLTLQVEEFSGIREMLFADEERLYQALRNVVANAIKYTPDGGEIIVSGRKLPGFVEITVADTGIGIDPDDHIRIFEKFGRLGNVSLHSSGKMKFKGGGPGLGLPITRGILEAHGGAIWVESQVYDEEKCPGSIFHILLPVRVEPPDEQIARLFRVSDERS